MYYGDRNSSKTQGSCRFCGKIAYLRSYDTREFFTIFFVPIVPLSKYRILNQCSSCRRHLRIKYKEFQRAIEQEINPLREQLQRRPGDEELTLQLVNAYRSYSMLAEAEQVAVDGASAILRSNRLRMAAGNLAYDRGDRETAIARFRSAIELAPSEPGGHLGLGQALHELARDAEALPALEQAYRLAPDKPPTSYYLAECLFKLSRWGEALHYYQRLCEVNPNAVKDRTLLSRMKQCKEHLGYPVSDAEKKAARWSFLSSLRSTGSGTANGKRVLLILGALLAAGIAVAAGVAFWKQNHVDVYFDNGLRQKAQIHLKDQVLELGPNTWVMKTLAPGTYPVRVESGGREVERYNAEVGKQTLLESLFDRRFYVYNVAEAHIYRDEDIGYGQEATRMNLLAFQHFFSQREMDYVFTQPPSSIYVEHAETRTAFSVAEDVTYTDLGIDYLEKGTLGMAEKAFKKGIELAPCETYANRSLVDFLIYQGRSSDSVGSAQTWIQKCPSTPLEPNRAYQDAVRASGRTEQLPAEYQSLLKKHPDQGVYHYLYGRTLADPGESSQHQMDAIRLSPELTWAHVALAYDFLALERYSDALAELGKALRAPDHDKDTVLLYAYAAIGTGNPAAAVPLMKTIKGTEGQNPACSRAEWLLELAQEHWDAAQKMMKGRKSSPSDAWADSSEFLEISNRVEELNKLMEASEARKDLRIVWPIRKFQILISEARYEEAAALLDSDLQKSLGSVPPLFRVYAAVGLKMKGLERSASDQAQKLYAELEDRGSTGHTAIPAMARYLRGEISSNDLLLAARRDDYSMLPHAYFILGATARASGNPALARQYFATCSKTAVDLDFPYCAARKLAAGSN